MEEKERTVRIDKWLWAMRLYKTRTLAADACRSNRISVNGSTVKPSRDIVAGDVVAVRRPPVTYTFRVIEPIGNRQGAKNVPLYMEDLTPQAEKDKLTEQFAITFHRDKGTGRPTKKERRELDTLVDDFLYDDEFEF